MTLVSIIIPVHPSHNRSGVLGTCLESIEKQTYPKENLELVLIGDGCRLRQDLSSVGIRTVVYNFKTRVGATRARNKAIELASGELLAFLDADCVADDSWLEKLSGGFEYDDTGGCGGKTLDPKNRAIYEDRIHGNGYVF